jgi:hypothetical protein
MLPRPRPLLAVVLFLAAAGAAHADFPIGQQQIGAIPVASQDPHGALTACSRNDCLTVWTDSRGNEPSVFAIRSSVSTIGERSFRLGLPSDVRPFALASDGTDYLLACFDDRGGASGLAFAHIDAQNAVTLRTRAADNNAVLSRTLLWAGDAYVLKFQKSDGVHAMIVDRDGRILRFDVLLVRTAANTVPLAVATVDRITLLWPGAGGVFQAQSFLLKDILDAGFTAPSIGPATGGAANGNVASSGTNLLLTWGESTGSSTPAKGFARLLNTNGTAIGGTLALPLAPDITIWSGGVYLALAAVTGGVRGPQISAVRVERAGTLRDATPFAFANAGENEALSSAAPTDGGALVVWYDRISVAPVVRGSYADAAGRRRNGVSTDPGLLLSRGLPPQREAAVATRNNERLIAWVEESDLQRVLVARYDASGRQLNFAPSPVRNTFAAQRTPVLASDGHSAFLVWYETTADPFVDTLYGMWIAEGAMTGEAEVIDTVPANAPPAAVVTSGRQYVVAWQHAPTAQLFLARWSGTGQRIDATPIAYAPPRTAGPAGGMPLGGSYPALAWNGPSYYLVFAHEFLVFTSGFDFPFVLRELHGVRLSEALLPVGPERLISNAQSDGSDARQPDVLAVPNGFLIAWVQQTTLDGPTAIATRRVSAADEVFPAHGRERTADTPPVLVRAGTDLRLAFGTSFSTLDADGAFVAERLLDAPIVAAVADGARVLLIEQRIADDSRRLFGVPLAPPRVRAVR